jgi:hypothetical protein
MERLEIFTSKSPQLSTLRRVVNSLAAQLRLTQLQTQQSLHGISSKVSANRFLAAFAVHLASFLSPNRWAFTLQTPAF